MKYILHFKVTKTLKKNIRFQVNGFEKINLPFNKEPILKSVFVNPTKPALNPNTTGTVTDVILHFIFHFETNYIYVTNADTENLS